eukprot:jgi/Mesvir1/12658/Mv02209-RA.1
MTRSSVTAVKSWSDDVEDHPVQAFNADSSDSDEENRVLPTSSKKLSGQGEQSGARPAAGGAPIINEYKMRFVWTRLSQTFLGGLKLMLSSSAEDDDSKSSTKIPAYAWVIQIFLFILPLLVGAALSLIATYTALDAIYSRIIFGGVMGILQLVIQAASYRIQKKLDDDVSNARDVRAMLQEENVTEFDGWFGAHTFRFILPPTRGGFLAVCLHALFSGALCFSALGYLDRHGLEARLGRVFYLFYGTAWVSLCLAQYPLTASAPVDPNFFRTYDAIGLSKYTRAFYVTFISLIQVYALGNEGSGRVTLSGLAVAMDIIMLLFPLLWMMGSLPTVDALISWLGEQALLHLLGGSAASSDERMLTMLLAGAAHVTLIWVAWRDVGGNLAAIGVAAGGGLFLAMDIYPSRRGPRARNKVAPGPPSSAASESSNTNTSTTPRSANKGAELPTASSDWALKLIITLVAAAMIVTGIVLSGRVADLEGEFAAFFVDDIWRDATAEAVFAALLAGLYAVLVIGRELQRPYLLDVLRNPFFASPSDNAGKKGGGAFAVRVAPYLFRGAQACSRMVVLIFLILHFPGQQQPHVVNCILAARCFRRAWQHPCASSAELALYALVDAGTAWDPWDARAWGGYRPTFLVRIFFVGLAIDRAADGARKLACFVMLWREAAGSKHLTKAQRRWLPLFLPTSLLAIGIAAALAMPLLPLCGLPLLLLGFPRPRRCWQRITPTLASATLDASFYAQLAPQLLRALPTLASSGKLGQLAPGQFFLLRHGQLLVWLQVLETGTGYWQAAIKGLELQETSCHHVEAEQIDALFSSALAAPGRGQVRGWLNPYLGYTLKPRGTVPVTAYSDSRFQLTGILGTRENLRLQSDTFLRALIWLLHREHKDLRLPAEYKVDSKDDDDDDDAGSAAESSFPLEWFQHITSQDATPAIEARRKKRETMHSRAGFSRKMGGKGSFGGGLGGGGGGGLYDYLADSPSHGSSGGNSAQPASGTGAGEGGGKSGKGDAAIHEDDVTATERFVGVVLEVHAIIDGYGIRGNVEAAGESHVFSVYSGTLPKCSQAAWLEARPGLKSLAMRAYRLAHKLVYDHATLGPWDDDDELADSMEDLATRWHLGSLADESQRELWCQAMSAATPFMYALSYDEEEHVYSGMILSMREQQVPIGELNGEVVRAQWASTIMELLYFTNDDDERYSIQASPQLLRNLNVQSAEPPLGYSVYCTGPVNLRTCII